MTSDESEGHPRPHKRVKTNQNADENDGRGKKSRGRPRVDPEDATAADRRRTQIRLAQRAYRQRKETTIASLTRQNAHLQSVVEQMNDAVVHFQNFALQAGLSNPRLVQALQNVVETFCLLKASAVREGSDNEDRESADGALDPITELHNATSTARESNAKELSPAPAALSSSSQALAKRSFLHSDITADQVVDQPSSQNKTPLNQQEILPFGIVDMRKPVSTDFHPAHLYDIDILTEKISTSTTRLPTLPLLKEPSIKPVTYSFNETTFARRLTRAAFEAGFHLFSSPDTQLATLRYVFRLSLPYMSLDDIRERFKQVLSRGTNGNLDFTTTPFQYIGGAGTHYPRDRHKRVVGTWNPWDARTYGPVPVKVTGVYDVARLHNHSMVDFTALDLDGEWFDPEDVQGWLAEEKGCHIEPRSSFAEVLIDADDDDTSSGRLGDVDTDFSSMQQSSLSPSASTRSSAKSVASGSTPPKTLDSILNPIEAVGMDVGVANPAMPGFENLSDADVAAIWNHPLGLDLAAGLGLDGEASTADMSYEGIGNFGLDVATGELELPVVKQKPKKAALMDIDKFIEELVKQSTCLGRAPGFRREDVEASFQASIISAV